MSVETAHKLNQREWESSSSRRTTTHFSLPLSFLLPFLYPFLCLPVMLSFPFFLPSVRTHTIFGFIPLLPFLSPSFVLSLSFSSHSFSHFLLTLFLSYLTHTFSPHPDHTGWQQQYCLLPLCNHCFFTYFIIFLQHHPSLPPFLFFTLLS